MDKEDEDEDLTNTADESIGMLSGADE